MGRLKEFQVRVTAVVRVYATERDAALNQFSLGTGFQMTDAYLERAEVVNWSPGLGPAVDYPKIALG